MPKTIVKMHFIITIKKKKNSSSHNRLLGYVGNLLIGNKGKKEYNYGISQHFGQKDLYISDVYLYFFFLPSPMCRDVWILLFVCHYLQEQKRHQNYLNNRMNY